MIKAQYSRGKCSGDVDPAAELKTMMDKFKDGSVFRLTKVTLADEKTEFIGAPLKICIDLRKTKCAAILQSLVAMPPAPAPAEELASILGLGSRQRVDITALMIDIGDTRRETTAYGKKDIIDITIVDGSTIKGEEPQVSAKMSMFFDVTTAGTALLESMQEAHNAKAPVAMYGLTCAPQGKGRCEFK